MLLLKVIYTKHAREQMVARGISTAEVERAIKRGSKEFQKPDKILSHYAYYCVVFKKVDDNYVVLTVKPR